MNFIKKKMRMTRLNLRTRMSVLLVLLVVCNTSLILMAVVHYATQQFKKDAGQHLAETAAEISDQLDRDMWTRAKELELLTSIVSGPQQTDFVQRLQRSIDKLSQAITPFSWVGFMNPDGIVVAATNHILIGKDISKRPVYAEALHKSFVGDVHDAVLLAYALPNPTGEAMKFVDLSFPVRDGAGTLRGVLAAHLSWKWVDEVSAAYLDPVYEKNAIEIFIVSRDGTVLLGPKGMIGLHLDLAGIREVHHRNPSYGLEHWPDGQYYLTGTAFGDGYKDYAGLGWTVITRQQLSLAYAPVSRLQTRILLVGVLFAGVVSIIGALLSRHLTAPLHHITVAANRLLTDRSANIPHYAGIPEIEVLTETLRNMVDNLRQTTMEKELMEEKAYVDALTQLSNRASFEQYMENLQCTNLSGDEAVCVMYIDLDGFKKINDTFGHAAGDTVLKAVGLRLRGCVRKNDFVARLGGDEFVVVCRARENVVDEIAVVGKRMIDAVNLPIATGGEMVCVGCSIGCAVYPQDAADMQQVLSKADAALYVSKSNGKNILTVHQPSDRNPSVSDE